MRERADAIARTLTMEQGKPLAEAKAEMLHSADTFEWFARGRQARVWPGDPEFGPGKRHVTIKHPVGVVARHQPVEFPDHAASPQDRARSGGRLHHRLQAREPNAAVPRPGVRVHGRGGAAGGRRQSRHRAGAGDGRRISRKPDRAARSASPARPKSASN